MKLIIYTQCEENYGAHDWDGRGQCPQYWKPKGGETYVVRNISKRQARRIEKDGIPTLSKLLTMDSEGFREYIIGSGLFEDDAKECESWETPIQLHYNVTAQGWRAQRRTHNDGHMVDHIHQKVEYWTLTNNGGRDHYHCYYILKTGECVVSEEIAAVLTQMNKEVDAV